MIRAVAAWILSAGLAVAQSWEPEEVALLNAEFDLWHQAAIVLSGQHGGTTSPADATLFALGRIADGDDAASIERLLPIAEFWLWLEARNSLQRHLKDAGVDGDLARQVLCYVAGEGPGPAHQLIAEWGLPRNADGCEARFAERLDTAAEAYRAYAAGVGGPVIIRYGDDSRWSQLAARNELLETVAEGLDADFVWPAGLTLEMVPCTFARVEYKTAPGTVRYCSGWIWFFNFAAGGEFK